MLYVCFLLKEWIREGKIQREREKINENCIYKRFHLMCFSTKTEILYTMVQWSDRESGAVFLFPCCIAAGCSPVTSKECEIFILQCRDFWFLTLHGWGSTHYLFIKLIFHDTHICCPYNFSKTYFCILLNVYIILCWLLLFFLKRYGRSWKLNYKIYKTYNQVTFVFHKFQNLILIHNSIKRPNKNTCFNKFKIMLRRTYLYRF